MTYWALILKGRLSQDEKSKVKVYAYQRKFVSHIQTQSDLFCYFSRLCFLRELLMILQLKAFCESIHCQRDESSVKDYLIHI